MDPSKKASSAAVTLAGMGFEEMRKATDAKAELAAWDDDYREVPKLNGRKTWRRVRAFLALRFLAGGANCRGRRWQVGKDPVGVTCCASGCPVRLALDSLDGFGLRKTADAHETAAGCGD